MEPAVIVLLVTMIVPHGMMFLVAEPNDSPRDRAQGENTSSPETAPEIVDAEVVEDAPRSPFSPEAPAAKSPAAAQPAANPAQPQDDETFRQYQQFLEFQKFQEWQRQQGDQPGERGGTDPFDTNCFVRTGPTTPWWRRGLRLLRYRFVRRAVYLLLALILLPFLLDHWFSGGEPESPAPVGTPGNQDPGLAPVAPSTPKNLVIGVYSFTAQAPNMACDLFTNSGKRQFAAAHRAPDCTSAVHKLHQQVTAPESYAIPGIGKDAVVIAHDDGAASSCKVTVEGGPRLGKFGLHRQPNGGWLIDSYQAETC